MPMPASGAEAFLEMLADAGVEYLFGNPGSTELPLMDVIAAQDRIRYLLGLQEVPVVAMADGYAQASGSLGVVNLHISCGLGNAMGMIYNARRSGSPLLVTAGQQDRRLAFQEPVLWSDLVDAARPWTKWAVEVDRLEDLPSAVRRAVQTALTPPTGPVFMALPVDMQMERRELERPPVAPLDSRVRPPAESLRRAADILAAASNPGILVGSRVTPAGAVGELVRLAEALGAPVIHECATGHGRLGFPPGHPLAARGLPLWSPEVRERLADFDVLFVAGMDLLCEYIYHEPARAIPEHIRIIHLDNDAWQLGKNYPLEVALLGDIKSGLAELEPLVRANMTPAQSEAAARRAGQWGDVHRREREALVAEIESEREERPMSPLTLMSSLADVLPDDVAVVEEAVTTTRTVLERLGAIRRTDGYFAHRGWALGWGVGCALGVKVAWPQRPVLALVGEGALMYGVQGLWTAAHYRLPVTFVVCNNATYQILKDCAHQYGLPGAAEGRFEAMDLVGPEIDYVALARSLGVEAQRVDEPGELADLVSSSLGGDRPRLFDVPIRRGGS